MNIHVGMIIPKRKFIETMRDLYVEQMRPVDLTLKMLDIFLYIYVSNVERRTPCRVHSIVSVYTCEYNR